MKAQALHFEQDHSKRAYRRTNIADMNTIAMMPPLIMSPKKYLDAVHAV